MPTTMSGSTEGLLERMEEHFRREFSGQPTYRFQSVPLQTVSDVLDFSDPELKRHFLCPPRTRPSGFTLWDVADFRPSAEAWRGRSVGDHLYTLTREGYFELDYPIDGESHFQWLHHKYPSTPPWLYPLAVCEMAVSCCRYVSGLVDRFGLNSELLVKHEYLNIQGYWLPPRRPDLLWTREVGETRYTQPDIAMKYRTSDFAASHPDEVAWELVKYTYSSFGLTADEVPYFDENRRFTV